MAKTHQVNVRLDEATLRLIDEHPSREYESQSSVIRHLLRIGYETDSYDRAQKARRLATKEAARG